MHYAEFTIYDKLETLKRIPTTDALESTIWNLVQWL